jgi:hypothetical protein
VTNITMPKFLLVVLLTWLLAVSGEHGSHCSSLEQNQSMHAASGMRAAKAQLPDGSQTARRQLNCKAPHCMHTVPRP